MFEAAERKDAPLPKPVTYANRVSVSVPTQKVDEGGPVALTEGRFEVRGLRTLRRD